MSLELAEWIATGLGLYAATGVLFALAFVTFGARRINPAAEAMPLQARLVVFPGVAGLWPLMLMKWFRQKAPPEQ